MNGTCINGYQGSVSRVCIQSGSIGNWKTISGSCDGDSSYFHLVLFLFEIHFSLVYFDYLLCPVLKKNQNKRY